MSDDPREQVEQVEQVEQAAVPQDAVADLPPDETEQSKVQGGYVPPKLTHALSSW
jgi:hypothetical protein